MAAGAGDRCNSSLKMLQSTPHDDFNESRYPITSSIETKSCEVFIAHQGIYVKYVSIIIYAHNFLLDKNTIHLKWAHMFFVHIFRISAHLDIYIQHSKIHIKIGR